MSTDYEKDIGYKLKGTEGLTDDLLDGQSATGGATPVMPDLAALKGLEHLNHLELVGFGAASASDADAGRHLVDLANLRRLLVIPHYAPEVYFHSETKHHRPKPRDIVLRVRRR